MTEKEAIEILQYNVGTKIYIHSGGSVTIRKGMERHYPLMSHVKGDSIVDAVDKATKSGFLSLKKPPEREKTGG